MSDRNGRPRVMVAGPPDPAPVDVESFATNLRRGLLVHGRRRLGRWSRHATAAARRDTAVARGGPTPPDVVLFQHASGPDVVDHEGSVRRFLATVAASRAPIVTTFHTIRTDPSPVERDVVRALAARSARCLVLTRPGAEALVGAYDLDASLLTTVGYGMDDEVTRSTGVAPSERLRTVGTTTWLRPGAGIENAVRAVARLDHDVRYVVVDLTPRGRHDAAARRYVATVAELIRTLGLGDRVTLVPADPDRGGDLDRRRRFRVAVVPDETRDPVVSTGLVRALVSATPVVATSFPHADDVVPDGVGTVVAPGDPDALASAVQQLLDDDALRHRCAIGSWRRGLEHTWPIVASQYESVVGHAARTSEQRRVAADEPDHRPVA